MSFEKWAAAALGTLLLSGIMFLAGRDRKQIDDAFDDSRRDRAEIRMSVTSHETQLQLMKQRMDLIQNNYEKLSQQNEETSRKLDAILRELKK